MKGETKGGRAAIMAAVAVLMLAAVCFVGVGAGSEDVSGAIETGDVASIGEEGYATLDAAIDAANGTAESPAEIKLLSDATLSKFLKNVKITAVEKHTITLTRAIELNGIVTLENVEIAADAGLASGGMLFYVGNYNAQNPVTLTMNNVSFDESTTINGDALTVYLDKTSTVNINDSDFTNSKVVYIGSDGNKPTLTLNNTVNVDMNVSTGTATVGTDIIVEGTSTIGDVKLADGIKFIVPEGETFKAKSIGLYSDSAGTSTGSIVTDNPESIDAVITDVPVQNEDGQNVIFGNVTYSDAQTISTNTIITGNVTITKDGSITVADSVKLTIQKGAIVNLYGSITAGNDAKVINYGTVNVLDSEAKYPIMSGTGVLDTSAIAKDGNIGGEYGDNDGGINTKYPANQVVTVNGYLTLTENLQVTFNGTLIIPEGTTVTLEDASKLILDGQAAKIENNGTIIVSSSNGIELKNGAVLENNGTITLDYVNYENDSEVKNVLAVGTDSTVVNNSAVTIGIQSEAKFTGTFENAENATLDINGTVSGTIENSGVVTVNGKATNTVTVNMAATGATVNVNHLEGTLKIYDATLSNNNITVLENGDNETNKTRDQNRFSLTSGANSYVSGLTVVSEIVSKKDANGVTQYYNNMVLSGDLAAIFVDGYTPDIASNESATGILITNGPRVIVNEKLNLGAGIKYQLNDTLTVVGEMYVDEEASIENRNSTINVDGGLITVEKSAITGATINAVYYTVRGSGSTPTMHYYTTLSKAIESGVTPLVVKGTIDIESDVTIPSGITVRQETSPASLINVAEGATLTVSDGASIANGNVNVKGTLYIAVKNTGFRGGVAVSEVYATDGTDATYTSLANAMAGAESGDVIELNGDVVLTLDSLTIKSGVTVDTKGHAFDVNGSTVVIDGTLFLNNGSASMYTVDPYTYGEGDGAYEIESSIVLNGYIKSDSAIVYNDDEYPAGAYYTMIEKGIPYYYATTAANAAAVIGDTDGDTVTLFGKLNLGDIAFAGAEDSIVTVVIDDQAEISAGTVTVDYAIVSVETGAKFTGKITNGTGTYAFTADKNDNKAFTAASTVEATVNDDGAETLTIAGNYNGIVGAEGTVYIGVFRATTMNVTGNAVVTGNANIDNLYIEGTVDVDEGGMLSVTDATVLGTLSTAVASETVRSPGRANVTGILYVGLEKGDLVNLGADAVVSGNVAAATAYVANGSTVPKAITDYDSTEYYIGDVLWMTAYAGTDSTAKIGDVKKAPVENAVFEHWFVDNEKVDVGTHSVGETGYEVVYALIDENIYTVTVIADKGIGTVAIDGNILNNNGGNGFIVNELKAGQHKLTYTLNTGFTGTATMTIDGQAITGDTFTLSGVPEEGDTVYVTIYLSGTEPVDNTVVIEGGNSEMGLTDYLLIILVILIVIMAIMVALRLMRS